MAALQPVRGTHDLLPAEERRQRAVAETARAVSGRYGFEPVVTPIFEFTDVFQRTLGDTSDVVSKEMYTFTDRSGDSITLRPEGTAGVCRAMISNSLTQTLPQKFFYFGPMFRHERPQKGRQRQFHQIGIELIGAAQPLADVEAIACGADILDALGVLKHTVLELNTLGNTASRTAYRAALVEYFQGHLQKLSVESAERLSRNPLRILDSKDEGDRAVIAGAPAFAQYLDAESQDFFAAVRAGLDAMGIAYVLQPRLVRGLDYYCHTAFEFVTTELGAQGTVMGGGRYDGLIGTMGGPETPGVGWAAGVERLMMLIAEPAAPQRPVTLVPMGDVAEARALGLARDLRRAGVSVDLGYGGNMKKRLQRANRVAAKFAVILGEDELARGVAGVRDLDAGTQEDVAIADLVDRLKGAS